MLNCPIGKGYEAFTSLEDGGKPRTHSNPCLRESTGSWERSEQHIKAGEGHRWWFLLVVGRWGGSLEEAPSKHHALASSGECGMRQQWQPGNGVEGRGSPLTITLPTFFLVPTHQLLHPKSRPGYVCGACYIG